MGIFVAKTADSIVHVGYRISVTLQSDAMGPTLGG